MKRISINFIKRFFQQTFAAGTLFAISVYLWVRILLHDIPFEIMEETSMLLQMILTSCAVVALCTGSFYSMSFMIAKRNKIVAKLKPMKYQLTQLLILVVIAGVLAGCNAYAQGIKKDMNTGMVTHYKGLVVEDAQIVMNNEVLGHTDIPIGESFVIINQGIKGLTVKSDKVSVGCSLTITDKNGNVLLSEPDLFKGNDVLDKNKAEYLKCTVNTGAPMEWEEKYNVKVVFTDKYGTGTIENNVTIRIIDIP